MINLSKIAKKLKNLGDYPVLEIAHMEMAEPTIAQAYTRCVEQGATHIICHPYFLSPGKHVNEDIPELIRAASDPYPDVTYSITPPFGAHEEIVRLIAQSVDAGMIQTEEICGNSKS